MLVDRDTLGTCFPFPSPFPGTISLVPFQIQASPLLVLNAIWASNNSALVGKVGFQARVARLSQF